jgi:hypothetical protein
MWNMMILIWMMFLVSRQKRHGNAFVKMERALHPSNNHERRLHFQEINIMLSIGGWH